jgi:uncharacterized membrane protein YqgA involved in biofilm formation
MSFLIGTLINTAAILVGSFIGILVRKGLPQRLKETVMQGLGLCVLVIGVLGAIKTNDMMAVILSIVIGGLIGALLNIEKRLDQFGQFLQRKLSGGKDQEDSSFATGFVTASLVYCVGAMAIVGALESGLQGNHNTLIAKSALDGISAIVFASTMGPGVALSALAVLVYQGSIAILAQWAAPLFTEAVITEMSAVGGLLIIGVGMNLLRDKRLAVGNLLPAIFVPMAYLPLSQLISRLF